MTRRFSLFITICFFSHIACADIYSASAALTRGDYDTAAKEFKLLAAQGDAKAQANLGYMYYVGEGVPQSYEEAVKWYRKSAVQGDKDAQYNLAVAYAFGEGIKQDYKEAALWYRRAAEQGHLTAQYSLGISYSYGEGVKQDREEATKWLRKAAEQGYPRAQVHMGSRYHTGDGVKQDYDEAVNWYRKAADHGDAAAQYNLGNMYRSGKGVTQNYNQAIRWFRLAADQGYAAAQNELASLERAIAGAARSQTRPNLQPTPIIKPETIVEKTDTAAIAVAKAEQQAIQIKKQEQEQKALFSVEKSDLLTLDDDTPEQKVADSEPLLEEEQIEAIESGTSVADAEVPAPAPASAADAMPEKKSKDTGGFFSRFFKSKKETTKQEDTVAQSTETILSETADTDADSEAIELLAMDSVEPSLPEEAASSVETGDATIEIGDESIAMEDTEDTIGIEAWKDLDSHVVNKDVVTKKKSGGLFSIFGKLFKQKQQRPSIEASHELQEQQVSLNEDDDTKTEAESSINEIAEVSSEPEIDSLEEKPEQLAVLSDDQQTTEQDQELTRQDGNIAMDGAEDTAAIEAWKDLDSQIVDKNVTAKEKSKSGFFKKLFGWKKQSTDQQADEAADAETDSEDEAKQESSTSYAADIDTQSYEASPLETLEEPESDQSATLAENDQPLESDEEIGATKAEPKVSFFSRLFGDDPSDSDKDTTSDSADATTDADKPIALDESEQDPGKVNEETLAIVHESTDMTEASSEPELPQEGAITTSKEKKGFFSRLFGKSDKTDTIDDSDEDTTSDSADATTDAEKPIALDESEQDPGKVDEKTLAMVHESTDMTEASMEPELRQEDAIITSKEKKGFFSRLFGKSDKTDTIDDSDDSISGEEMQKETENLAMLDEEFSSRETDPQQLELAFSALDERDYDEAYLIFHALAVHGDGTAQYQLGSLYYQGLGIRQDYSDASLWYRRASEQGNVDAQYSLGNMFLMGEGVKQDDAKASFWYQKAAAQGHTSAKHNLDNIQRVSRSKSEFVGEEDQTNEVIELSNAGSEPEEKESSGGFFRKLFSRDKNESDTPYSSQTSMENEKDLADEVAVQENTDEQSETIDEENNERGFFSRIFGKGDKQQSSDKLATISDDEEPVVTEDTKENLSTTVNDYKKGIAYTFGEGVSQDNVAAFNWFMKAAEQGYAPAQYKVGAAYAYGDGVEKDQKEATKWYTAAAQQGYSIAQRNLGVLYSKGEGVEQDKPLALAWYSILADTGNVMDVRRRDILKRELTESELEQAEDLKNKLSLELSANTK